MYPLKITVFLLLSCFFLSDLPGQGCVAIRGNSSCGIGGGFSLMKGEMIAGANYRYFKSFRHFRGSEEEHHRIEEGTQVINYSSFLDFFVSCGLSDRWYGNLLLPFVFHSRSSMYEHGGNPPGGLGERHETSAYGLADLRLEVGYWLVDPLKAGKCNAGLALGVKLPTGSYDYTDTFYNQGENRDETRETVVDQSIQPGDGGLGLTLSLQGFYQFSEKLFANGNLYYLSNPRATNGVLTRSGRSEFSCPDQYAVRIGLFYQTGWRGLNLYLGGRWEGVPSEDLVGGSEGYRRPGYAISLDPGLSFDHNPFSFTIGFPLALYRNRIQSYEDKQRTAQTGMYRHGDAAFADYLIDLRIAYRFGGHKMP